MGVAVVAGAEPRLFAADLPGSNSFLWDPMAEDIRRMARAFQREAEAS